LPWWGGPVMHSACQGALLIKQTCIALSLALVGRPCDAQRMPGSTANQRNLHSTQPLQEPS
jgi:hypothetical protein